MSPTIRGAPRSAGSSSSRIECVPSRRAAVAAGAWTLLVCAIVAGGVALPMPLRVAIVALVAGSGFATSRSVVGLRGLRAVRTIEWGRDGGGGTWWLELGPARRRMAASLAGRSFRFGRSWLVLAFTTRVGTCRVLVDARVHDPRAFRRLCREFSSLSRGVPRPHSGSS